MEFVSMTEVRKKFKKEKSPFHKAYFDAYNNPQRNLESLPINKEKINELLIQGKMTQNIDNYYRGKIQGLKDRGLLQ
jgi:hypothetical protein